MKFLISCSPNGGYQRLLNLLHDTQRRSGFSLGVAVSVNLLLAGKVLEVGVVAGLLGRNATGRVVHEKHLQQLQAVLVKVVAQHGILIALPLRE